MALPGFFKSILWFTDFSKVSLKEDRDLILMQALEKGRMEHLKYLARRLGPAAIWKYAQKHARQFSRKSVLPFAKIMFSGKQQ